MTPSVFSVRPAAASEYLVRCAVRHRSSCVGTGLARQRVAELATTSQQDAHQKGMGSYGTIGHPTSVLRMDILKRIVKCLFSFTELLFLMQKSGP